MLLLTMIFTSCNNNINEQNKIAITETTETTELQTQENTAAEAIGGNLEEPCIHEKMGLNAFHGFPVEIHDLVTDEQFDKWMEIAYKYNEEHAPPECKYMYYNVYEMIKYFKIPRDTLEQLYECTNTYYLHDYNIDLFYSGDDAAVYEYYANGGNKELMEHRVKILEIKYSIRRLITFELYQAWSGKETAVYLEGSDTISVLNWSIPEFIYHFNISEDDFIGCLKIDSTKNLNYLNYDKIYRDNADIKSFIESGMLPRDIDDLVCGDKSGMGGLCRIHKDSYHEIMPELIEFVEELNYIEWMIKTDVKDRDADSEGCKYPMRNIYQFILSFPITKEDFMTIYNSSENRELYDYNIDLLYGGDEAAILEYYNK